MKISLRTLIVASTLILILALGGLYFFFQNQSTPSPNQNDGGLFNNLFPFLPGNNDDPNLNNQNQPIDNVGQIDRGVPLLRKISDTPVSGAYVYGGDQILIRYIERNTGHVFETEANGFNTERISNTTIPGINEALWFDENNLAVRYLSDSEVETFLIKLEPDLTEQSVNGKFVDSWDRSFYDKKSGQLFSVFQKLNGSSLTIGEPGEDGRVVLNSPISSWIPLQSASFLFVQTAPHSSVPGSLFKITNGQLSAIATNLVGLLVTPNTNTEQAIISFARSNAQVLADLNFTNGEIVELPLSTLATKCVWSDTNTAYCGAPLTTPAGLPEIWMTGQYSFDDALWEVDVENRTVNLLTDPLEEVGEQIDVWQPMVDETGSYMIFINKRDLTLWSLRLKDEVPENTDAN